MSANNRVKRIISLILVISSLVSVCTLFSSCSKKSETFLSVGEMEVSYDMVRYFVMNYKAAYSKEELEDPEILKQIEENTIASIKELYTYKTLAKTYGVKLTSADKKEINSQIEATKDYYGSKSDYEKDLEANFVTEAVYKEILELEVLCDKLYDRLTENATDDRFKSDNATIDADLATDKWYSVEYVYLFYDDKNKEERHQIMLEAREDIAGGVIMSKFCDNNKAVYGADIVYAIDGCFTEGEYNDVIYDTAKALEIGKTSEVIDYSGGAWIIIRRLEISDDYIDKNYNTIIAKYLSREFFNFISEESDKLSVTVAEKFKDTPISSIK